MKCIILAAGRGKRMMPLTNKVPKPLLTVKGKALIDHVLWSLPLDIDEIIIVIKYRGDQIKKHIGERFNGRKVSYVIGSDDGDVYSFLATKEYLNNERFLLVYGDEIPKRDDVIRCLSKDLSVLTYDSGVMDGVMVLNTDIYDYKPKTESFRDLVKQFKKDHKVSHIESNDFIGEINTPERLEAVNNG